MSIHKGLCTILILLAAGAHARAQDTARAIVEKAVRAHGGLERLSRIRADQVQVKGNLFVEDRETPFAGETTVQLPGQFKNVLHLTTPKGLVTLVQIVNGDKVLVTIDGQPQKVDAPAMADIRETLQVTRATRLVPLLTDRSYELTTLPEIKVNDRPALGVRITARGRRELRLFFDRDTSLLVKSEHTTDAGEGKEVRQEIYYGDFRDLGGYRRPAKLIALRDGKKVMEAELTDVKYFDKIDDAEFTRP
jgi:hypothetical protein